MKLKSCSVGVGMPRAMGPRRKVTREEEGMSHRTLRCFKGRKKGKKERVKNEKNIERKRE